MGLGDIGHRALLADLFHGAQSRLAPPTGRHPVSTFWRAGLSPQFAAISPFERTQGPHPDLLTASRALLHDAAGDRVHHGGNYDVPVAFYQHGGGLGLLYDSASPGIDDFNIDRPDLFEVASHVRRPNSHDLLALEMTK